MTAQERATVKRFLNSPPALGELEARLGRWEKEGAIGPWVVDVPEHWRGDGRDFMLRWARPSATASDELNRALNPVRRTIGLSPALAAIEEMYRPILSEGWRPPVRWELVTRPDDEPRFAPAGVSNFTVRGEVHERLLHVISDTDGAGEGWNFDPDGVVLLCGLSPLAKDMLPRTVGRASILEYRAARRVPGERVLIDLAAEFDTWLKRRSG